MYLKFNNPKSQCNEYTNANKKIIMTHDTRANTETAQQNKQEHDSLEYNY